MIIATLGNTVGSVVGYAIGAWGGRPFLERWGKYLLIRPHELELADHFFQKYGPATAFFSRLMPIVRTFISFPAGRGPDARSASSSCTRRWAPCPGRSCSSGRASSSAATGSQIRHMLQPYDLAIAVLGVLLVALLHLVAPRHARLAPRETDDEA